MTDFKQAFEVESRKTGAQQIVIGDLKDKIERMTAVARAAEILYRQLHNIETIRPRWANESVCEAMVVLGKALDDLPATSTGD